MAKAKKAKQSNLGGARPGAGRPKGEQTKAVGVRVPVKYHAQIAALVKKEVAKLTKKDLAAPAKPTK